MIIAGTRIRWSVVPDMVEMVRSVAPTKAPVSVAQAKDQARYTLDDQDSIFERLVASVTAQLDGRDGWLGRAIMPQTWKLYLDGFPCRQIQLPFPPLQSVTSIVYVDTAGASQTLSSSLYEVVTAAEPGLVQPIYGGSWPSARVHKNAVTITYVAGYADSASVPPELQSYILAMVEHYWRNRGAVVTGAAVNELPFVRASIASLRVPVPWR